MISTLCSTTFACLVRGQSTPPQQRKDFNFRRCFLFSFPSRRKKNLRTRVLPTLLFSFHSRILGFGVIRTPSVEAGFRRVDRRFFVPRVSLHTYVPSYLPTHMDTIITPTYLLCTIPRS